MPGLEIVHGMIFTFRAEYVGTFASATHDVGFQASGFVGVVDFQNFR